MTTFKSNNIPSMTPPVVHSFLYETGKQWSGKGIAMELGCWLGASSVPLLKGLVEAGYDQRFWAFDRWRANADQVGRAAKQGEILTIGQSLIHLYLSNVNTVYERVIGVQGDLPGTLLHLPKNTPIEISIFDAPKKNPVFAKCIQKLLINFIPGTTVLGLLDYHQWKKDGRKELLAPVNFIREHKDNFQLMAEWPEQCSCAFFKYVKPI